MFSHVTAARLHGIKVPFAGNDVWVTIPCDRHLRRRHGVILARPRDLPKAVRECGLPVTPLTRTLVDLSQILDQRALLAVLHDVTRSRRMDVHDLWRVVESLRGKRGVGMLREVLGEFDVDSESVLEDEADRLLAGSGLRLERQVEVRDGSMLIARLDFADRARRLAIEADGLRYHSDFEAMNRDRRRDRTLSKLGWTVIRYTADDIRRHPTQMIKEIGDLLAEIDRRAASCRAM
jgi:very-short-patch-repair endonuclease